MDTDDVHEDEMAGRQLSEAELLELLTGSADQIGSEHPVASFFADARHTLRSVDAGAPSAALSEYLNVGKSFETDMGAELAADVIDLDSPQSTRLGRAKVASAAAAFIGTLAGKIVIGSTVAFAATAGVHVAGVVDVPILPDFSEPAVVETTQDELIEDRSASASSSSPTPTTAVPVGPLPDDSTPSSTTKPAGEAPPIAEPNVETSSSPLILFPIDGVGAISVRVTESLLLLDASPQPGWTARVESDRGDEIEVRFSNGTLTVEVEAEFEDGLLRIRVTTAPSGLEETFWFDPVDGSAIADGVAYSDDDDDSDDDHDDDDDESDSDDDDDDGDHDDDESDEDDSDDSDDSDDDHDDSESDTDDDDSDDEDDDDSDTDDSDSDTDDDDSDDEDDEDSDSGNDDSDDDGSSDSDDD